MDKESPCLGSRSRLSCGLFCLSQYCEQEKMFHWLCWVRAGGVGEDLEHRDTTKKAEALVWRDME